MSEQIAFEIQKSEKGVQTFEVEMENLELIETGTKVKDGKVISFYKFKIVKK